MRNITELLKLQGIETDFYKVSKGWIFENMDIQEAYDTITLSILTNTIPDWEQEEDTKVYAETLKTLIGRLNLDQLEIECKLIEDIWNYADQCEYDDICECIDITPLEALGTINDIISVNDWVSNASEVVEAWG